MGMESPDKRPFRRWADDAYRAARAGRSSRSRTPPAKPASRDGRSNGVGIVVRKIGRKSIEFKTGDRSASPFLILIAGVLFAILAIEEADLHRNKLSAIA